MLLNVFSYSHLSSIWISVFVLVLWEVCIRWTLRRTSAHSSSSLGLVQPFWITHVLIGCAHTYFLFKGNSSTSPYGRNIILLCFVIIPVACIHVYQKRYWSSLFFYFVAVCMVLDMTCKTFHEFESPLLCTLDRKNLWTYTMLFHVYPSLHPTLYHFLRHTSCELWCTISILLMVCHQWTLEGLLMAFGVHSGQNESQGFEEARWLILCYGIWGTTL
eukprot:PhF_6_TR15646/c1_g1_i2/m.24312